MLHIQSTDTDSLMRTNVMVYTHQSNAALRLLVAVSRAVNTFNNCSVSVPGWHDVYCSCDNSRIKLCALIMRLTLTIALITALGINNVKTQ